MRYMLVILCSLSIGRPFILTKAKNIYISKNTNLDGSHQTMLWYHKALLYSFYFFPFNNVVTPQSLILLIQFLPVKQCCDISKLDCTHLISFHPTLLWRHKVWLYSFYIFPSTNVVTPQWQPLMFACLDKYTKQCCDITSVTVLSVLVLLVTKRMTIFQPIIITALFAVIMETNIKLSIFNWMSKSLEIVMFV